MVKKKRSLLETFTPEELEQLKREDKAEERHSHELESTKAHYQYLETHPEIYAQAIASSNTMSRNRGSYAPRSKGESKETKRRRTVGYSPREIRTGREIGNVRIIGRGSPSLLDVDLD